MSTGPPAVGETSFSIFPKVFENEENRHILTSGQLKYKNTHIWMKNVQKSKLSKKKVHRSVVGQNFNFFDFSKSFRK